MASIFLSISNYFYCTIYCGSIYYCYISLISSIYCIYYCNYIESTIFSLIILSNIFCNVGNTDFYRDAL